MRIRRDGRLSTVDVGAAAVWHLSVRRRRTWLIAALGALAAFAPADGASAAVVRSVHAIAVAAATRVIVDVDGAFRYRTHASDDGRTLFIDIAGATLAEEASRIVPVSDHRLDGVNVIEDAVSRVVRVSVNFAGPTRPRLASIAEGSRLVLSFADATRSGTSSVPHSRSKASPSGSDPASAARSKPSAPETVASAGPASKRRSVLERPVVVLDPGHGGRDPGAQAWTGEYEKDIVLDLAERVARRLRKNGDVEVVMTRSGDEYVELADRRDTSKKWGADVFVSIHANASASGAARGIETYYHSAGKPGARSSEKKVRRLARAENRGKQARGRSAARKGLSHASLATGGAPAFDRHPESIRLARSVQTELVQSLGMRYETVRDLGAKEGPFFVIGDNAAPSVLVEAAFLTHREEGLRMRSEVYREQIANGVSRGIRAFLEEQRRDGAL